MNIFPQLLKKPAPFVIFLTGILAFTLLWAIFLSKRGNFWSTLEHELTHALFAILFFKKINSIAASRKKGGVITIEGGNAVIALSPYFFPLAATVMLIIKLLVPSSYEIYVIFFLGFTYQFHIINLLREFHVGQSDLHMSGFIFSIVLIIFSNIVFLGIILSSLGGNWAGISTYVWEGIQTSSSYLKVAAEKIIDGFVTG